jgi:hypothetical protein
LKKYATVDEKSLKGIRAKREIKISDLKGITKSTLKDVKAMVIHVKGSYDEYLYTSEINEIIEALK